jgi:hypothetical protein
VTQQVLGHRVNSGHNERNSGSNQVLGLGSWWDHQVVGGSQFLWKRRFEVWGPVFGVGFCGTKVLRVGFSWVCGKR